MSHFRSPALKRTAYLFVTIITAAAFAGYFVLSPVSGADINKQTLQIAKGLPSENTEYNLSFDVTTPGTLGSIKAQFCSNSPLVNRPCSVPAGMDVSQANLTSQTGPGGFSVSGASDANTIILTRTPSAVPLGNVAFHFDNVVNPSSAGSYYARVYTYATNNASGTASDSGGIAFSITNEVLVSATVPPYLIFCTGLNISGLDCATASGDYIDFGELSARKAARGSSQMLVASNAAGGHSISVNGTTLTSGNNIIAPLPGGDVSRPGVAQFGFNLRANSSPAGGANPIGPGVGNPKPGYDQANIYRFVNGDVVASTAAPDDVRQYTASYLVNVAANQPPGIYVSTITYVCLANF